MVLVAGYVAKKEEEGSGRLALFYKASISFETSAQSSTKRWRKLSLLTMGSEPLVQA